MAAAHLLRRVGAFVGLGVVVLVVVSTVAFLLSEVVARRTALDEAAASTERLGRLTVAPLLTGALAGDTADRDILDRLVALRVQDGQLRSLVVWTADGTVLYATDPTLVGRRFPGVDEVTRAARGEVVAGLDEAPETRAPGEGGGTMVEVYAPMPVPGDDLVVEAYFSSDGVQRQTDLLRGQILLVAVGGLVVLQCVQVPIAVSMARRIHRDEQAISDLAARTLAESERERRTIAGDLHDGPVQDVAAVAYALGALRLGRTGQEDAVLDRLAGALQDALGSLRRSMVDVYPPDLSGPGLGAAVTDLARAAEQDGLTVEVSVIALPPVAPEVAAAVYRSTRELVSNARRHARAQHLWVELTTAETSSGQAAVALTVADDGIGLPEHGVDRRAEGHLGLRLVQDRVADVGGTTSLGSRDGGGTEIVVVLPVRPHRPG
ncbi:MAG: histidine kinase [Klenkia sp.]|nr:histidine kinase [Klenkia sp.]